MICSSTVGIAPKKSGRVLTWHRYLSSAHSQRQQSCAVHGAEEAMIIEWSEVARTQGEESVAWTVESNECRVDRATVTPSPLLLGCRPKCHRFVGNCSRAHIFLLRSRAQRLVWNTTCSQTHSHIRDQPFREHRGRRAVPRQHIPGGIN